MIRRPPRSTRTDTLFPYTTLFRSAPLHLCHDRAATMSAGDQARKSKSQRLGPHVARAPAIKNLLDVLPCLSAHERLVSSLVQASAPFKGSRVQAIPQQDRKSVV